MDPEWSDNRPIYRQIHERIVAMILDGVLKDEAALPSVRTVAADSRVNHLTVLKAYQQLEAEGLVEKRRGLGMFVRPGAREALMAAERERFMAQEWPEILEKVRRLGLTETLLGKGRAGR